MTINKKNVYIKVIRTEYYYLPKGTSINGWTIPQIIQDWFFDYPLRLYHATRESYCIGGSERLVSAKVVTKKQYIKDNHKKVLKGN